MDRGLFAHDAALGVLGPGDGVEIVQLGHRQGVDGQFHRAQGLHEHAAGVAAQIDDGPVDADALQLFQLFRQRGADAGPALQAAHRFHAGHRARAGADRAGDASVGRGEEPRGVHEVVRPAHELVEQHALRRRGRQHRVPVRQLRAAP